MFHPVLKSPPQVIIQKHISILLHILLIYAATGQTVQSVGAHFYNSCGDFHQLLSRLFEASFEITSLYSAALFYSSLLYTPTPFFEHDCILSLTFTVSAPSSRVSYFCLNTSTTTACLRLLCSPPIRPPPPIPAAAVARAATVGVALSSQRQAAEEHRVESGRAMLRARQDEFHLHLVLFLFNVPDSLLSHRTPRFHPPATASRAAVPPSPAAVPHSGADWTHRARRCAPARAKSGTRPCPSGTDPRRFRHDAGRRQLLTLQPESGARDPAARVRRPGVPVPVRVPGRGGAGSVRRARLPTKPRGTATGGIHGVVLGDSLHQRH